MTWPHGDPNAVVKQILAQPAYHVAPTKADSGILRFWYEFWNWIGRLTQPFWDWLDRVFKSAHGVATPLTYIIVAVTILAVGYLIVRIVLAFAKPAADALRDVRAGRLDERRTSEDWQRLAAAAAAEGQYATAIAALFAAALAALDERMLVPFDASRTPGEYRRLVRSASNAVATPFDVLCERFVYAVFAAGRPVRADYDEALGAYRRLAPS